MAHRESLWRKTARLPGYAALESDLQVDVAIVGGGITALTAALLLKRAGRRVAVLEARTIGAGVTGFTTAHLTEALDTRWYELAKSFGRDGARLAAESQRAAIERIAAFVEEEKIDCAFRRLPGWLFAEDARGAGEIEKEAEATRELGMSTATADPPLPFPVKRALRFENQAQFHPLRYLGALAAAVHGGGSAVFESTRAIEFHDGEPCRIRTPRGTVTCQDIIVATHSPVNDRIVLHTKISQYRSYVVASRQTGPRLDGLFWDTDDPYHYIRAQEDGEGWSLIVGGADHKVGHKSDTLEPYLDLKAWTARRFPGAKAFDDEWSAQVVETVDGLPYVGRNPTDRHTFIGTGYSGNGMTHGTMAGILLSDLVQQRRNPWSDLYDPGRIKPKTSALEWVKENVSYPVHFIGDRVRRPEKSLDAVPAGEGRIVEVDGQRLAVYRDDSGALSAVSPVCTHMACEVVWNPAERSWDCPCHGGRFSPSGEVLDGPPPTPLSRKKV